MGRRLVVGLGNPGPEYDATWHNLGFHAVRALAKIVRASLRAQNQCLLGRGRYAGHDIFLLLPQTYMNRSGEPVARIVREQRIYDYDTLVLLDDHDLPRGQLRMRESGGDGGHRGFRSILNELGTSEIPRLRIGFRDETVDPKAGGYQDLADRVLEPLSETEHEFMMRIAEGAGEAARDWLALGIIGAMNHNNNRRILAPGDTSEAEGEPNGR
ncbi:MAG: aminoacyl-tRNA hydrolase [bacterium]